MDIFREFLKIVYSKNYLKVQKLATLKNFNLKSNYWNWVFASKMESSNCSLRIYDFWKSFGTSNLSEKRGEEKFTKIETRNVWNTWEPVLDSALGGWNVFAINVSPVSPVWLWFLPFLERNTWEKPCQIGPKCWKRT